MNPGQGLVVKICGLRQTAAAVAAVDAGADLLGFNFAPVSRRRVGLAAARAAIVAARNAARGRPEGDPAGQVDVVGVFVNQTVEDVVDTAARCGLDAIQLSGTEDAGYCRRVTLETGRPVIKSVRLGMPLGTALGAPAGLPVGLPVGGPGTDGETDELVRLERFATAGGVASLLVDAPVAGSWGGSGQGWDWTQAAPLARRLPILLAGGLSIGTVGPALVAVGPWGVDVASGVETDGQTDPIKVAAFIARVRQGACRE